jgi:hypothetical protein
MGREHAPNGRDQILEFDQFGIELSHTPWQWPAHARLIMRLAHPPRIRLPGRDCRTTKMPKRDARAAIAANAAQIRLCVKTVIARLAQSA